MNELYVELIEGRLLEALSQNTVLSYAELKTRSAGGADDRTVRRVLHGLIARGLVRRQADRKGMWFLGYAKVPTADRSASPDDVPAPFAPLLRQLAW